MPGIPPAADGYGETFTTTVNHMNTSPYDCVSWGAIVFSTAVKDDDHDGAPDAVEDGVATVGAISNPVTLDADGSTLPNLPAMHGSSGHKDIYFQMDAMRTIATPTNLTGITTYGNATNAPFPGVGSVTIGPHSHLPTPSALKIVADTYLHAPVTNTDGSPGIWPHFDVGDPTNYIGDPATHPGSLGGTYQNYFCPAAIRQGRAPRRREAVRLSDSTTCQFQYYRDGGLGAGYSITSRARRTTRSMPRATDLPPRVLRACAHTAIAVPMSGRAG